MSDVDDRFDDAFNLLESLLRQFEEENPLGRIEYVGSARLLVAMAKKLWDAGHARTLKTRNRGFDELKV